MTVDGRTGKHGWSLFGHVRVEQELAYAIWSSDEAWQLTAPDARPTNEAGYGDLDALLSLKGLSRRQVVMLDEESNAPAMGL